MTHLEILPASLAMGAQRVSALTPQAAAREFEAMLIAQLMKTAREAGALHDSADAMTGAEGYLEIAERQLAEALAAAGAFGFARMILEELEPGPAEGGKHPPDSSELGR